MSHQSYDGLQHYIREMKTPEIETWKNEYSDKDYTIEITTPEFTAVCPKTGLPDFGTIQIRYSPDEQCAELKSLKDYFLFYRDVGIFHEHVVNKILEDFVAACDPRWAEVVGDFNVRGGIKTVVRAKYDRSPSPEQTDE
ncbi:MAG: preQ(1) synthase [Candidatus Poribacteria bacterium]|nr:preQ(1) synthase [Candidatus Poribacteria bacterium]